MTKASLHSNTAAHGSSAQREDSAKSTYRLVPWYVKERDLRRYLGRALTACEKGHVLLFHHFWKKEKVRTLFCMSHFADGERASALAFAAFRRGRFRRVSLEERPSLGRRAIAKRTRRKPS